MEAVERRHGPVEPGHRAGLQEDWKEFDFLKGDEGYKSLWCDAVRQESRLIVYNKRWRGSLARVRSKLSLLSGVKHHFDRVRPAGSRRGIP